MSLGIVGQTIAQMTHDDVEKMLKEATEAAINEACCIIQQRIGQTDGGIAGLHFSGNGADVIKNELRLYFYTEKNMEAA